MSFAHTFVLGCPDHFKYVSCKLQTLGFGVLTPSVCLLAENLHPFAFIDKTPTFDLPSAIFFCALHHFNFSLLLD